MIRKDTVVVLISTAAGIGITTVLSFFIVWIGFPANNPQESFKDALEFSVGLFGGLATFGAAVIAAHLFNDWRVVKKYEINHQYVISIKSKMTELRSYICNQRNSFIVIQQELKKENLSIKEYQSLNIEVQQTIKNIIDISVEIILDMQEINYLKTQNSQSDLVTRFEKKLSELQDKIKIEEYYSNFYSADKHVVFESCFKFITNDFQTFVYDDVFTNYLEDLKI
ncbi:hypothetical protein [Acinetobacter thermotolerans]|uniref:hypothetical protein n=1 Tax=Acinetobacter thermotolerans TaxID=3151487 RepID=UPI00325B612B